MIFLTILVIAIFVASIIWMLYRVVAKSKPRHTAVYVLTPDQVRRYTELIAALGPGVAPNELGVLAEASIDRFIRSEVTAKEGLPSHSSLMQHSSRLRDELEKLPSSIVLDQIEIKAAPKTARILQFKNV